MTTILYTHEACSRHDPGPMHPESPSRLAAVKAALDDPAFEALDRREPPEADNDHIALMHPDEYVERVLDAVPDEGTVALDADTQMSPGSGEASRRAVGAACAAIDAVMAGEASNAFCAVRPPGHHAEQARPMGFCMFNNVAIGAEHARKAHGCERVAVVDFDVHHGNGTQAMFWNDRHLMFASTHQFPLYPGTGRAGETGVANNIVNVELAPGAGSAEFREAMGERVLPALRSFGPDFLLVSAGFDAHAEDPLAGLNFLDDDYAWAAQELMDVADACCEGRLVATLEGGYNLDALGRSVSAFVGTLMQD
ncbi:MAG: histone deacetylase family protein [Alphaproteobacteria bacterium]|jgi:acetoin utilization deacetylase AcuC-like enzyme|nr:histone deacetylase family protein [Alphaproteobacteria bacterium]MDP6602700.1 histone deacetylase family protein [Rhodospirillales bacterium]